MNDFTLILKSAAEGEHKKSEALLPLIYDELRRLAQSHMSREFSGHTLQATALVHEAYLRLLGDEGQSWDSRGHFFAAAAEAMRRILIESARRKKARRARQALDAVHRDSVEPLVLSTAICVDVDDLLALDEALVKLADADAAVANVVKLHCFAGLPLTSVADVSGVSVRTVERLWAFGKTWLYAEISGQHGSSCA